MSYHDGIQAKAKEIEQSRGQIYSSDHSKTIRWSETQTEYLMGAIYKLLRVKNETKSIVKAKDDLLDAYNYVALLYNNIEKEVQ